MSADEHDLVERLHALAEGFEMPGTLPADDIRRGRRRVRRARAIVAGAAAVAVITAGAVMATITGGDGAVRPVGPVEPELPILGVGTNGWVALDDWQGGDIYLARPGEDARRLEVAGSDDSSEACPAWSPDGTRLMFGRLTGSSETVPGDAELVIVPVDRTGAAGSPTVIEPDGFGTLPGFDPHPCGTWAPDGRWVALRGPGEVWVVDTQTEEIRPLADLRPVDLEWRPGTDELAIAGDMGTTRAAEWAATPVTFYSVSANQLRQVNSVVAASLAWSPDGSTLAYEDSSYEDGNEPGLRLVDPDGDDDRSLVANLGGAMHGIGPVWSPTGERIVYQRVIAGSSERHEVVLVDVANGTQTVIAPPTTNGADWYPFHVTWSPDGTTLLFTGWSDDGGGVLALPADTPSDAARLSDLTSVPGYTDHRWVPLHTWGRQPE
jgi:WD40 repeat protein